MPDGSMLDAPKVCTGPGRCFPKAGKSQYSVRKGVYKMAKKMRSENKDISGEGVKSTTDDKQSWSNVRRMPSSNPKPGQKVY